MAKPTHAENDAFYRELLAQGIGPVGIAELTGGVANAIAAYVRMMPDYDLLIVPGRTRCREMRAQGYPIKDISIETGWSEKVVKGFCADIPSLPTGQKAPRIQKREVRIVPPEPPRTPINAALMMRW